MNALVPITDIDAFVATCNSAHQFAEHVLAKARYIEDGKVELTAFAGGFATPLLSDSRRVRLDGVDVVVDQGLLSRRAPLTTIAEAAAFAEIEAGFPTELYAAATPLRPTAPLFVDRWSVEALAAWFSFTANALGTFAIELASAHPSPLVLWPEHFDQAFFTSDSDERRHANYGASPGDAGHPEPYLYVGPWGAVAQHKFWNATHFNGAVLALSQLVTAAEPAATALQFLREGRALLAA